MSRHRSAPPLNARRTCSQTATLLYEIPDHQPGSSFRLSLHLQGLQGRTKYRSSVGRSSSEDRALKRPLKNSIGLKAPLLGEQCQRASTLCDQQNSKAWRPRTEMQAKVLVHIHHLKPCSPCAARQSTDTNLVPSSRFSASMAPTSRNFNFSVIPGVLSRHTTVETFDLSLCVAGIIHVLQKKQYHCQHYYAC